MKSNLKTSWPKIGQAKRVPKCIFTKERLPRIVLSLAPVLVILFIQLTSYLKYTNNAKLSNNEMEMLKPAEEIKVDPQTHYIESASKTQLILNNQEVSNQEKSQLHSLESEYKPRLLLHIGPPKTGTTTIQCEFIYNAKLLEDHSPYRYMGKWKNSDCEGPVQNISYPVPGKWGKNFYKIVKGFLEQSISPLHSSEQISMEWISSTSPDKDTYAYIQHAQKLQQNGHETKFVATYRRYFEWVPSYYRNRARRVLYWSTSLSNLMNQDVCLESVQSYIEHIEKCRSWVFHKMDEHPIQMIQNVAGNTLNVTVDIFNMHDVDENEFDATVSRNNNINAGSHLFQKFVSKMLDQSVQFQTELQMGNGNLVPPLNTYQSSRLGIEYVHLMVKIHKLRLVSNKVKPNTLWEWLQQNHETIQMLFFANHHKNESLSMAFPLTCPDEGISNHLLDLSLKFEKELFPEWSKAQMELHRKSFKEFVEKKQYCQWDTDAIMNNAAVAQFIGSNAPGALHGPKNSSIENG